MTEILCKCGCGQAIIIQRHHRWRGTPDFIHGHSSRILNGMRGRNHSEETRRKFSEIRKGQRKSEAHKRKISESQKGKIHTPGNNFKKGNTIRKGRSHSEETREKIRQAHLGLVVSVGTREKISMARRGIVLNEEGRKKLSAALKGRALSDKHRHRISIAQKRNWQDPSFCRKMGVAWGTKPNKPEMLILQLLDRLYPGQWKYTGDFSMTINGKCPDFVNCNGQKKIIELFGDYWHEGENPQERIDAFRPFGYETLVIWGSEMKNSDAVMNRIRAFVEA